MSRSGRKISSTNYYHIILRGVNRADIFLDDQDRGYFLKLLFQYADKTEAGIVTYCLMANHVHLLIFSPHPGELIRRMASGYVYYFNHKYERIGHLFQERFKSEAVEDESYLLTVFRYILRNPEKAGISPTERYPWSGFHDLISSGGRCDCRLVAEIAGGIQHLIHFVLKDNSDECMDLDKADQWTDVLVIEFLKSISNTENPAYIRSFPKKLRNQMILQASQEGISVTKLARATGLSINTVRNILRQAN